MVLASSGYNAVNVGIYDACRNSLHRIQPALQRGPRAHRSGAPHLDHLQLCRAVDLDGALHSHLHAGVGPDRRGHELVAGAPHDPARQHHRARADPAQLAPGHEVRHSVPGVRARGVRHPRLERAGADARAGGLRLVRHPGVDRRRRRCTCSSARCGRAGRTLIAGNFGGHTPTEWMSFLLFWGLNIFIIYRGMDLLRKVENWAAPFVLVMTARAGLVGADAGARARSDPGAARASSTRWREFWPVFVPVADRDDRLLGDALAQHARLHALRPQPARAGGRPGGRAADDDDGVRGDGRR